MQPYGGPPGPYNLGPRGRRWLREYIPRIVLPQGTYLRSREITSGYQPKGWGLYRGSCTLNIFHCMGICPSRHLPPVIQYQSLPRPVAFNAKLYAVLGITSASGRARYWFRTAVRRVIFLLRARKKWAKYGHHQQNNYLRKRLWQGLVRRGGTNEVSGFLVRTKGYTSERPDHPGTERQLPKEGPGRVPPYNFIMDEGFFIVDNLVKPKPKPKPKRRSVQSSR